MDSDEKRFFGNKFNYSSCTSFEDITWVERPGNAIDIASGVSGDIFISDAIDTDSRGVFKIKKWSEDELLWEEQDGACMPKAVDPAGKVYCIDEQDTLFKQGNRNTW